MSKDELKPVELTLDFDNSVTTEDRFSIRHFLENFVDVVNNQSQESLEEMISKGATAEGFTEFVLQQPQILEMFYKKFFGRRRSYISFSKLKLTFSNFLFHISGDYEEYSEGILTTAGTIELAIMKTEDGYQVVKLKFYPRMRMSVPYSNVNSKNQYE